MKEGAGQTVAQAGGHDASVSRDWRTQLAQWEARVRPRIGAFWRWWSQALLAWLPDSLRDRLGLWPQRLLLRSEGDGLRMTLLRGGAHELGMLALDMVITGVDGAPGDPLSAHLPAAVIEVPRWLLLPTTCVLRRRLRLPAAAGERLREVTAFEIDRQTPFSRHEVVHDARLLGARADGQVEVELVVITRAALDTALDGLGPLAAGGLSGIDVMEADGTPLGLNLLPVERRRRRARLAGGRQWGLVALTLVLLLAALWQALGNRREAVQTFAQSIATNAEAAREVTRNERRVRNLVEGAAFLQAERARRPAMIEVMDALAQRLPDSTWLEKLSIEGGRITLIGLSADASALVERLQDSALWRAPALAGVVQSDPGTRLERFTLVAELTVMPVTAEGR